MQDSSQRRGRPRGQGHHHRAASTGPSQWEGEQEESTSPFSTPSPPLPRPSPAPPAPPKASPRIPNTKHVPAPVLTTAAPKSARTTLAPLATVQRPSAAPSGEDKLARTFPAPATQSNARQPRTEDFGRQPRTVDDYVTRASQELLARPGLPSLRWRTVDTEADYRQLRPGEFFNHFQNNRVLTTKAGLAQSLTQHMVWSSVDVDSFFPRCYDTAQKSEREDFVLDFRRSAVLKIALLHQRLHKNQVAGLGSAGYCCNRDLLWESEHVLQRWCLDLDPDHLDEEQDDEHHEISEDTWDALMVYSELTQAQLCAEHQEGDLVRVPRRQHTRPGGGDHAPPGKSANEAESHRLHLEEWQPRRQHGRLGGGDHVAANKRSNEAESHRLQLEGGSHFRPAQVQDWPEFHSHSWGKVDDERQSALDVLLELLDKRFAQWSLQGGWSSRNVWIVKPGTNSKGSGIECMSSLPDILRHTDRMPNRLVQKYIERPLLLFSGRKFDVRQWVLVKSVSPLKIFLFSECYLRLCNGMYDLGDLRDRERHISNWQVNKNGRNVVDGAAVSLSDFRSELLELTGRGDCWEKELLPSVKKIVVDTLRSAEGQIVQRADSFELFGFDLMVDEAMKVWLLEVNLSPGCEGRTPFLEQMLERMSHRLIEVAVLGKEEPDGQQPDWIKICDDGVSDGSQAAAAAAEVAKQRASDPCRPGGSWLAVEGVPLRPPKPPKKPYKPPAWLTKGKEQAAPAAGVQPKQGTQAASSETHSDPQAKAKEEAQSGAQPSAGQDEYEDFEDDFEDESPRAAKGNFPKTQDCGQQDVVAQEQTAQLQSKSAEQKADHREMLKETNKTAIDADYEFEDDFEDESPKATKSKLPEVQGNKSSDGSQAQAPRQPSSSAEPSQDEVGNTPETPQVESAAADDECEDDSAPESPKVTQSNPSRLQQEEKESSQKQSQRKPAQLHAEIGETLQEGHQAENIKALQGTEAEDEFEDDFEVESPRATKSQFPDAQKDDDQSQATTAPTSPHLPAKDIRGQEKQDGETQELDANAAQTRQLAHRSKDVEDDESDPFEASTGSAVKAHASSVQSQRVNQADQYDDDFEAE